MMDRTIRKGMRDLSTKQKSHPLRTRPPLQNHCANQRPAFHPSSYGSNHRPSEELRVRQHPDHCQPRMLERSPIPSMPEHHHRTSDRQTVLSTPLPLVWAPPTIDHGQGPPFHLPLWPSTGKRTGDILELFHCLPPPDRWTFQAKEPVGRAISLLSGNQPSRLVHHARPGHANAQ